LFEPLFILKKKKNGGNWLVGAKSQPYSTCVNTAVNFTLLKLIELAVKKGKKTKTKTTALICTLKSVPACNLVMIGSWN